MRPLTLRAMPENLILRLAYWLFFAAYAFFVAGLLAGAALALVAGDTEGFFKQATGAVLVAAVGLAISKAVSIAD